MTIISLLVIAQEAAGIANVQSLLEGITRSAARPREIEVIVKFGNDADRVAFAQYISSNDFPCRAIGISVIRRTAADRNADYNDCYLNASRGSELLVPVTDCASGFVSGWDDMLRNVYVQARERLGHNLFTLQYAPIHPYPSLESAAVDDAPMLAITRAWADAVCGFGLLAQISGWVRGLHYYLERDRGLQVRVQMPSALFSDTTGEKALTNFTPQLQAIFNQQAKTIQLLIESLQRSKNIAYEMRNGTIVDAIYKVADTITSSIVNQIAYRRYVMLANPYIMRLHSYTLIEVMYWCALEKRGCKDDADRIPVDWRPFISDWKIRDMNPLPTREPEPTVLHKENI